MAVVGCDKKFSFQPLFNKKFISLSGKDLQELLMKWDLNDRLRAQAFVFDQSFQSYEKDKFAIDFLQDATVLSSLQVLSSSGKWVSLGNVCTSVTAEPVACTAMSMAFFDRLYDNNVVRESGHIVKCFDDFYEDLIISDELRKVLLMQDSDNYDLFTEDERNEFLFRLFRHLCLGGAVCQFEDTIQPYLDATKAIYKDLISVKKDAQTNELQVTSHVYSLMASDSHGTFYPSDRAHVQNFAYLIIDPSKRHVIVFYHKFGLPVCRR